MILTRFNHLLIVANVECDFPIKTFVLCLLPKINTNFDFKMKIKMHTKKLRENVWEYDGKKKMAEAIRWRRI